MSLAKRLRIEDVLDVSVRIEQFPPVPVFERLMPHPHVFSLILRRLIDPLPDQIESLSGGIRVLNAVRLKQMGVVRLVCKHWKERFSLLYGYQWGLRFFSLVVGALSNNWVPNMSKLSHWCPINAPFMLPLCFAEPLFQNLSELKKICGYLPLRALMIFAQIMILPKNARVEDAEAKLWPRLVSWCDLGDLTVDHFRYVFKARLFELPQQEATIMLLLSHWKSFSHPSMVDAVRGNRQISGHFIIGVFSRIPLVKPDHLSNGMQVLLQTPELIPMLHEYLSDELSEGTLSGFYGIYTTRPPLLPLMKFGFYFGNDNLLDQFSQAQDLEKCWPAILKVGDARLIEHILYTHKDTPLYGKLVEIVRTMKN